MGLPIEYHGALEGKLREIPDLTSLNSALLTFEVTGAVHNLDTSKMDKKVIMKALVTNLRELESLESSEAEWEDMDVISQVQFRHVICTFLKPFLACWLLAINNS